MKKPKTDRDFLLLHTFRVQCNPEKNKKWLAAITSRKELTMHSNSSSSDESEAGDKKRAEEPKAWDCLLIQRIDQSELEPDKE
jgi:hypothetical protein